MPSHEAIVTTALPQQVEKPIPNRTVTTRFQSRVPQNQDQQPAIKNSAVAESPPAEESVRLSPQLSALARKEQAFRQKELALKQREDAMAERLAKAERFEQLETGFKSKDYSKAEELGMSYEEYTNYLLTKQSGEDPLEARFKEFQAKIDALEKSKESANEAEFEETVGEYKSEISQLLESKPEFSRVKNFTGQNPDGSTFNGIDAATKVIVDAWMEDSIEIDSLEAIKLVDEEIKRTAKFWRSFAEEDAEESAPEIQQRQNLPRPNAPKTLTNDMAAGAEIKQPRRSLQHMSDEERYAEARRRVLERREKGI